jgi:hypothetical protein
VSLTVPQEPFALPLDDRDVAQAERSLAQKPGDLLGEDFGQTRQATESAVPFLHDLQIRCQGVTQTL